MLKKILIIIIIFLVVSSFSVLARTIYEVDDNTGNPFNIAVSGQLGWNISFAPYGSENRNNNELPRVIIPEAGINLNSSTIYPLPWSWRAFWEWDGSIIPQGKFIHKTYWSNTNVLQLDSGSYNFDIQAWGDSFSEDDVDYFWPGQGYDCADVISWGYLYACAECLANPNQCTGTGGCGWACNGITLRIDFYDDSIKIPNAEINDTDFLGWNLVGGDTKENYYEVEPGLYFMTDNNPGHVHIQQTVDINFICQDECNFVEEIGCESSSQEWECLENLTTHCFYKNYTDCEPGEVCDGAAGECVAQLTSAFWANMIGTPINQTNLSDRVKLMVPGLQLGGKTIEYEIWKVDGGFWFFDSREAQFSDRGFTTWWADETGEYYFIANIQGVAEEIDSRVVGGAYGTLGVLDAEDNSPPVANIVSPEKCDIYFTNEEINFTQNSYDIDDEMIIEWDFGDGVTSDEYNTTHSYSTAGQKTIILTITDERGLEDDDMTSVLVIDTNGEGEKYVCGYINEPEWEEERQSLEIFFNASKTYAVEASGCGGTICSTINCLAGECKQETANSQVSVTGTNPNWAGFSNLNFSWTFDDGIGYKGKGLAGAVFKKLFGYPGTHWAKVNVSINPKGSTETKFSIKLITECQTDRATGKVIWWDLYGFPHDTLDPLESGICLDIDGGLNPPHCCPPGYICIDPDTSNPWPTEDAICQVSETECMDIVACDDYLNQADCLNDSCGVALSQPGNTCGGIVEVDAICGSEYFTSRGDACRCEWNGTSCFHKVDLWSPIYENFPVIHSCSETTEHGECVDGIMSVRARGSIIWNETYVTDIFNDKPEFVPAEIPWASEEDVTAYLDEVCAPLAALCGSYKGISLCGEPLVKLIFFTLRNLIIAVCIIVIIYSIILYKKKKR